MKKLISNLSVLLLLVQNINASMCTLENAKKLVENFISNEIECGKHNTLICEFKSKKMISRNSIEKAGINLKFLKAEKYKINSWLIEDYKIINSIDKGNNISFTLELYNYSNNWYKKTEIRVVDENNKCKILPSRINSPDSNPVFITPYFNSSHHKM